MKLIVIGDTNEHNTKFIGLDCDECFTDYINTDFPKCVTGGYMSFIWNEKRQQLDVITVYETTRKLNSLEEQKVIDYTQGQWSDGIGEGFEQEPFRESDDNWGSDYEDDTIYNPSPWHPEQKVRIEYKGEE